MILDRISVATFNLYNLQLPERDMYPGQRPWSLADFDRKVSWIARVLSDLDADVVGLQELWHADAMNAVLRRPELRHRYDLLAAPATGERIVCGALVRRGLLAGVPQWVERFPAALRLQSTDPLQPQSPEIAVAVRSFSRPVLHFPVVLRAGTPPTQVFVAHLKSKLPVRIDTEDWYAAGRALHEPHAATIGAALSTIRRTAEAAALRLLVTGSVPDSRSPVVVLGDLNDGQHSSTVRLVRGRSRRRDESRPDDGGGDSSELDLHPGLTIADTRTVRDQPQLQQPQLHQAQLHRAGPHRPISAREVRDHVLVSDQFHPDSGRRLWLLDELVIIDEHLDAGEHRRHGSTDHEVVKLGFRYLPAQG